MSVPQGIKDFISSQRPNLVCNKCIADALGLRTIRRRSRVRSPPQVISLKKKGHAHLKERKEGDPSYMRPLLEAKGIIALAVVAPGFIRGVYYALRSRRLNMRRNPRGNRGNSSSGFGLLHFGQGAPAPPHRQA
ncbi:MULTISPECIES: hypothetical protein [Bradyrhizobium]|uniref:hypothetical protein n=1 Tax=Bradyrhizobium TaxID=374 RepID=UPI0012D310C7|nr:MULTISPECIES: hypothetical protein [Bradyrhizobium]